MTSFFLFVAAAIIAWAAVVIGLITISKAKRKVENELESLREENRKAMDSFGRKLREDADRTIEDFKKGLK